MLSALLLLHVPLFGRLVFASLCRHGRRCPAEGSLVMPLGPATLQWNPVADSSFERPSNNAVHRFLDVLQAAGIPASTRITRGAPPVMAFQSSGFTII